MKAGISICLRFCSGFSVNGTYFTSGDQPHQIDGSTITIVPVQNAGTASIRNESERKR